MTNTTMKKFPGPALAAYVVMEPEANRSVSVADGDAAMLLVGTRDVDGLREALARGDSVSGAASLTFHLGQALLLLVTRVGAWEVRTIFFLGVSQIDQWLKALAGAGAVTLLLGDEYGGYVPARRIPCAIPAEALTWRPESGDCDLPELLIQTAKTIELATELACAETIPGIPNDGIARTICAAVPVGVARHAYEGTQAQASTPSTLH